MGGKGAEPDWVGLCGVQMVGGSEPGQESNSSTVIPIVNCKRNRSKLCYCLVALCAV